jgi:thiol:disulfide interchange protein
LSIVPIEARPGQVVTLTITGKPRKGFHTYPLTMRTPEQLVSQLSKLRFKPSKEFQPLQPVKESRAEFVDGGKGIGVLFEHEKPFTWAQDVLVSPEAKPGKATLAFSVRVQVCAKDCVWGTHEFEVPVEIKGLPLPVPPEVKARVEKKQEIAVVPVPKDFGSRAAPAGDAAKHVDVKLSLPGKARPGALIGLKLTVTPAEGYAVAAISERTPDQTENEVSRLEYGNNPVFTPLWPLDEKKLDFKVFGKKAYRALVSPYELGQNILVSRAAELGEQTLVLTARLWVVGPDGKGGWEEHRFTQPVRVEGEPVSLSEDVTLQLENKPEVEVLQVPDSVYEQENGNKEDNSLWVFLGTSAGAAFLMLLTPCVFPMIPITVSFFLKQAESEHHKPLLSAGVYTLTIIVVLTGAVFLLGKAVGTLADNQWVNLGIGAVLIFFALSLFGMYEIELPAFLSRFTSAREAKGGYAGVFFMALTFTITSFTCTGPFLGPLLAASASLRPSTDRLVLGALVYATTFAAPFFLLALFPSALKRLPKSGGWLNAVKVVMGFLELGAALKFLANTDILLNPGEPILFSYDTVLCAWIALSALCGLYLLGTYRLPHDSPVENLSVPRMLLAGIFFGLAIYMVPLLSREGTTGSVGKGLKGFLPLDTRPKKPQPVLTPGTASGRGAAPAAAELVWHKDYRKAWELAVKEKKLLFIDHTGVNCANCRTNEETIFPDPAVQEQLRKYVLVQVYTDSVPDPSLSGTEAAARGKENLTMQDKTFHDVTRPLYVVFQPNRKEPFADGKFNGTELGRRSGLLPSAAEFAQFLAKYQRR